MAKGTETNRLRKVTTGSLLRQRSPLITIALVAALVALLADCNGRHFLNPGSLMVQQNGKEVTLIDFGNVPVGTTASQQVTIIFTSLGAQLEIILGSGPFSQINNCPTTSANGGKASTTCTLTLSVSPASIGNISGDVLVTLGANAQREFFLKANGVAAAGPVLSMVKTTQTPTYTAGGSVQFTLTVSNTGNAATSGTVTVTDTLDASLIPFPVLAMNWTCNNPSAAGSTITCTRSDALASGSSYDAIVIQAQVSQTPPSSITNTGSVSGGGAPNANGSVTVTLQ